MLLAHGADIDTAANGVNNNHPRLATSVYEHTHTFIDRWYAILMNELSANVVVDRRVGLGQNGLYQEPLERVLQYLGLSLRADQVVNRSLDDRGITTKRVLLPNCAHNAKHWFQLYQEHRQQQP
jgi:hypothetical protein